MTKNQQETKERILETASVLFSQFGFEGTSIRDIASKSDVNIASINYHFKTKEALYWSIFAKAHQWLDMGISDIASNAKNLEQLIEQTFEFMLTNKSAIRNAMKMMLSENIGMPVDELGRKMVLAGPPGGEAIAAVVAKEVGQPLSEEQLHWAVKSLLGSLIHWVMMCSTSKFELMRACDSRLSTDNIKGGIVRIGLAVTEHLKANSF